MKVIINNDSTRVIENVDFVAERPIKDSNDSKSIYSIQMNVSNNSPEAIDTLINILADINTISVLNDLGETNQIFTKYKTVKSIERVIREDRNIISIIII